MKTGSTGTVRPVVTCGFFQPRCHAQRAFTLSGLMVAMALLVVVSGGILASHIFGLRLYEFTRTRLGASDAARKAVNQLTAEIGSATSLKVGEGTLQSFQEPDVNTPQQGNAIELYPSTNTSVFIRYFLDPADDKLKRVTEDPTQVSVLAHSVSNAVVFTCEDFAGNVLSNRQGSYVVAVRLNFYSLQDLQVPVGPSNYYTSYRLQAKINRSTGD